MHFEYSCGRSGVIKYRGGKYEWPPKDPQRNERT